MRSNRRQQDRTDRRLVTRPPAMFIDPVTGEQCGDTIRFDVQISNAMYDGRLESKAVIYYGEQDEVSPEEFLARAKDLDPRLAADVAGKLRTKSYGTMKMAFVDMEEGAIKPPYRCYILDEYRPERIFRADCLHMFRSWIEEASTAANLNPQNPERIFRQGISRLATVGRSPSEVVIGKPFQNEFPSNRRNQLFVGRDEKMNTAIMRQRNDRSVSEQQGVIVLLPGDYNQKGSFVRRMLQSIDEAVRQQLEDFKRDGIKILTSDSGGVDINFESILGTDVDDDNPDAAATPDGTNPTGDEELAAAGETPADLPPG